jgi:hypothetical protein
MKIGKMLGVMVCNALVLFGTLSSAQALSMDTYAGSIALYDSDSGTSGTVHSEVSYADPYVPSNHFESCATGTEVGNIAASTSFDLYNWMGEDMG